MRKITLWRDTVLARVYKIKFSILLKAFVSETLKLEDRKNIAQRVQSRERISANVRSWILEKKVSSKDGKKL